MREDQIPQDEENFYDGHERAVYAKRSDGAYVQKGCKGWAVETYFTALALDAIAQEYQKVLNLARRGQLSPLAVHMTAKQMTPQLLAQHAGFFTFQVKRHLKPALFSRLSEKKLKQYAECLNLTLDELRRLPND